MCGLAGIVATKPIENAGRILARFAAALEHRGPDDKGFLTWREGSAMDLGRDAERLAGGTVALAHRRLSIVDLSAHGWQPMAQADGKAAIVYNGEIYNYVELARDLAAQGVTFESRSDTEVLLALLRREGIAALARLTGMYALALFEADRRRVILARDPFGIKPLYYVRKPGFIAFASEIGPLLDLDGVGRAVDGRALYDYLRHAVTDAGAATLFADVRQLPPGHTMTIALDAPHDAAPRPHWQPAAGRNGTIGDPPGAVREAFLASVRQHMRADVPVAATLSGGIDSSAIVSTMAAEAPADTPIPAFSYVADDDAIGEERWIDLIGAGTCTAVHKVRLSGDELAADLDSLIAAQEQPFGTTSIWAQARIFRAVRNAGFKVALDGQGADELLAGYPVFRAARLGALIRRGQMAEAARLLAGLSGTRGGTLVRALGEILPGALRPLARRLAGRPANPAWLSAAWFSAHAAPPPPAPVTRAQTGGLGRALIAAVARDSLPMLLRYADRNAMAVSVENRVPFLTTALADVALSLPDEWLIAPDGTTKRALRAAMSGLVPEAILARRDKIGFVTPERRWFAESKPLRAALARIGQAKLPPCFTAHATDRVAAVAAGRRPFDAAAWRIFNLVRWADVFGAEFPG